MDDNTRILGLIAIVNHETAVMNAETEQFGQLMRDPNSEAVKELRKILFSKFPYDHMSGQPIPKEIVDKWMAALPDEGTPPPEDDIPF